MLQKRFQYYSRNGIKWTKWFDCSGTQETYQLDNKLLNEYRTI